MGNCGNCGCSNSTKEDRGLLYFIHPINSYNTDEEKILLSTISENFAAWEIENPNQQKHQEGYKRFKEERGDAGGMSYFFEEVLPACGGAIALPFRDGKWGKGSAREIKYFLDKGLPVWQIRFAGALVVIEELYDEDFTEENILSVEETRARIRDKDGNSLPY